MAEPAPEFDALVQRHCARIWRSLRYLGVREADVADACQEVLLVVHRRLHEFRHDAKLETWIYAICLGVARNHRRKRQHASLEDVEPAARIADATQEADIERTRLRQQLKAALLQLPPEQREVFVLHEIEELGMRSIATAVGCPLFTAYSRLRLARRALARLLEGLGAP